MELNGCGKAIKTFTTNFYNFFIDSSLLENAGFVMSQRTLQWDMPRIYPGLQLRIGPSVNGGLMEFVVDPTVIDERASLLHEESSGMTQKQLRDINKRQIKKIHKLTRRCSLGNCVTIERLIKTFITFLLPGFSVA